MAVEWHPWNSSGRFGIRVCLVDSKFSSQVPKIQTSNTPLTLSHDAIEGSDRSSSLAPGLESDRKTQESQRPTSHDILKKMASNATLSKRLNAKNRWLKQQTCHFISLLLTIHHPRVPERLRRFSNGKFKLSVTARRFSPWMPRILTLDAPMNQMVLGC